MDKPATRARRQLSETREQELLSVARDVFFARGVDAATMDEIAQRAGASKATIYRRYKNKEELFEAIILNVVRRLAEALGRFELDGDRPAESLRAAAGSIRQAIAIPEYVEVFRQVIAEASRMTDLSRRARNLMTDTLTQRLTEFFGSLVATGRMQHDYPQQAAITFVLICSGGFRPLLNALGTPADEQRRFDADFAMFLRGCGISESD